MTLIATLITITIALALISLCLALVKVSEERDDYEAWYRRARQDCDEIWRNYNREWQERKRFERLYRELLRKQRVGEAVKQMKAGKVKAQRS